jgi:hypothetical protein
MVQVINTGGTLSSNLGAGIGRGLSSQIPKEIERHRLSAGLENLGKQDFSGENQIGNLAKIYNIPGMTPEIAQLLQQQIAKQNFLQRTPSGAGAPSRQTNKGPGSERPSAVQENGFATPEQLKDYRQSVKREPGYDEVKALADDYLNQGLEQDPQKAIQMAKLELNQNRQAQQIQNKEFKDDLNERLKLDLQGLGLGGYKDIAGKIQTALVDQGLYLVNNGGLSPEEASAQLSEIALNLAKSGTKLKETGSLANQLKQGRTTKATALREQKKDFEKYGFGEIFDDMVTAQMGFTPLLTAHILDPLQNQTVKDLIPKQSKNFKVPFYDRKMKESQLDKIIDAIKPSDNLFSIEYELRKNRYDVSQFKERVAKMEREKKIALSDQQKNQQKSPVGNSILGDILYESFNRSFGRD